MSSISISIEDSVSVLFWDWPEWPDWPDWIAHVSIGAKVEVWGDGAGVEYGEGSLEKVSGFGGM